MQANMSYTDHPAETRHANHLRMRTLIRLRTLAIIGQSVTVLGVAYGFGFPLPVASCFLLIACLALLNIALRIRYPATHRLSPATSTVILGLDILQLFGLLFITGGLANPFSVLICVPVIVASASLPVRNIVALGVIAVAAVTVLAFYHRPLPWYPGERFEAPLVLIAGNWIAIVSTAAFAAFYAYRVSAEAEELADALMATEFTLQREQHLSALDGLAAAAAHELGTPLATITVVAREMERALGGDERFGEDVQLLRSQSERCRDIMRRLATLSSSDEAHMSRLPLSSLIEEVIAPHREFGVDIKVSRKVGSEGEPVGKRNPGIIHGLGNLLENAVDFARTTVEVESECDPERVVIRIRDDGPGFPQDVLSRIGDPYVSQRGHSSEPSAGGLGLGLFIAKTLLERSGATLNFANRESGKGATVTVTWPRAAMEHPAG
ncbi:ActS/PrrB/RegB family redox-sensitive histidine kinase [Nitratireductor sp. XY-223]|uniref:ActS/PrrB/RegB family redox-sensitive histidine kinase n=1 Tax=Nitratireductor sp. XY-223 TaxID=2561926 RepID=UPI002484924B|nr:ActS/PrrB/RegB family redox-sensitive histidine kinase [Nitratireductor sp. XY-223]